MKFAAGSPVLADDTVLMPTNIIFVTSTGYWEESGDPLSVLDPDSAKTTENQPAMQSSTPAQRGYYKLVAVRQPAGKRISSCSRSPWMPQVRKSFRRLNSRSSPR
ncbi:hypothetical protein LP421_10415 [Rhizobium sp. RCAM05350]|nr:hypothetical protein LP421_10415 [Rhizobium sp. RCAM05350]